MKRLIAQLEAHALGLRSMSITQINAARALLDIAIPQQNVVKSELSGPNGGPIELSNSLTIEGRAMKLLQLLALAKAAPQPKKLTSQ